MTTTTASAPAPRTLDAADVLELVIRNLDLTSQIPDPVADSTNIYLRVPQVATGVELTSFVRILAFAMRFGEQNLLFARELGDSSRLLFRRSVQERVGELAPFLLWDDDALPVIADGRILWILDGYTASSNFPLARPDTLASMELRYLRSSVKATVDAVSGEVRMYAIGPIDPILQTYRRIFNGLIRDEAEMPDFVREHLRYPEGMFKIQAEMYQRYHITDPGALFVGDRSGSIFRVSPDRQIETFAQLPASVAALALARSIRTARVRMPRMTRKQSKGLGTAPAAFWWNRSRSASSSELVATRPPMTSECPPRYFVAECRTTSAPSSSGRCR